MNHVGVGLIMGAYLFAASTAHAQPIETFSPTPGASAVEELDLERTDDSTTSDSTPETPGPESEGPFGSTSESDPEIPSPSTPTQVAPGSQLPTPEKNSTVQETDSVNQRLRRLEMRMDELRAQQSLDRKVRLANPLDTRSHLGPSVSKIYFDHENSWQLGLSSEVFTFQEKRGITGSEPEVNRANVLSVAPALAVRLHPRLIFNSQFLFENGGSESSNTVTLRKGQSVVLMAYVDWLSSRDAKSGIRVGHQLVPVGWINTHHDPLTHLSVLRPELEREIIPSLWHENGISYWRDERGWDVQAGLFNSLDAGGFRGESFLAGGRSQGQNAAADDLMGVVRAHAKNKYALLGGSIAGGRTAQSDPALAQGTFRLVEVHARWRWGQLEAWGMYAHGQLDDAESISIMNSSSIGDTARGYSLELSYRLPARAPGTLKVFVRHSDYNLHAEMPSGYSADPTLDKTIDTVGAAYYPLPNLVLKTDYAFRRSQEKDEEDEFAMGLGLSF